MINGLLDTIGEMAGDAESARLEVGRLQRAILAYLMSGDDTSALPALQRAYETSIAGWRPTP